jgi:hypothetical protein
LISSDFSVAKVYQNKDETGLSETVDSFSENMFTYGNNNKYSVPRTITIGETKYTFCGYNVTLQSKYGLAAKYDGTLYTYVNFDSENHNDWRTSEIRTWLNGTDGVVKQKWYGTTLHNGEIVGLLSRLPDTNFMKNIIPTVTRTWTHSSWRNGTEDSNGCQHLADKFRLLGEGNINSNVDWMNDDTSDTSIFNEVFTEATNEWTKTRKRRIMKENGTKGSACGWWLRSASSDYSGYVGYVSDGGGVYSNGAYNYFAVLPACLIG